MYPVGGRPTNGDPASGRLQDVLFRFLIGTQSAVSANNVVPLTE